jgi:hypothetical protein
VQLVIDKIKNRASDNVPGEPLSHEQASALVRAHLAMHYSEDAETLTEIGSAAALDAGVYEFTFKSASGREYGGTVGELAGTPHCTRVWYRSEESG